MNHYCGFHVIILAKVHNFCIMSSWYKLISLLAMIIFNISHDYILWLYLILAELDSVHEHSCMVTQLLRAACQVIPATLHQIWWNVEVIKSATNFIQEYYLYSTATYDFGVFWLIMWPHNQTQNTFMASWAKKHH